MKSKSLIFMSIALFFALNAQSQSQHACGQPELQFFNLPTELYPNEEANFIARVLSYGFTDTLCQLNYQMYKDDVPIENISDYGSLEFTIRVQQTNYTTEQLIQGSGRLGFTYRMLIWNIDVNAATLGIFDGYCPGTYYPDNPNGARDRPFNFKMLIDEYGYYKINLQISKCSNAGSKIPGTSWTAYQDEFNCCGSATHSDYASENCDNPIEIYTNEISFNVVSTKILAQPQGGFICSANSHAMSVNAETNLGVELAYQWYKDGLAIEGATLPNYAANEVGTYYCIIDDGRETRQTDDAVVQEVMFADMPSVFYICNNADVTIQLPEYQSYTWSDESTNQSLVVNQAGTYAVTVVDNNNCTLIKEFSVEQAPDYEPITADTLRFCEGMPLVYNLDENVVTAANWNAGENADIANHIFPAEGLHNVEVEAFSCNYTDSVIIEIFAKPDYDLLLETEIAICAGSTDTLLLDQTLVSNPIWNNDATQNAFAFEVSQAGQITLTANAYDCLYVDTVQVIVNPLPSQILQPEYNFVVTSLDTIIYVGIEEAENTYLWNTGAEGSILAISCDSIEFPFHEQFELAIMNDNYCQTIDTTIVTINFDGITSINENEGQVWSIVPNPTNGYCVVYGSAFDKLELFDVNGRLLETYTQNELDFTNYTAGIYYVKIFDSGKVLVVKLVVE